MKKSELYHMAIVAVLRSDFSEDEKVEVLTMLLDKKGTALFVEEREAEKEAERNEHE